VENFVNVGEVKNNFREGTGGSILKSLGTTVLNANRTAKPP